MNKGTFLILAAVAACVTGCVGTVTETKPGAKPAYQDRVEIRYDRPVAQVYEAAKDAITSYGHITKESEFQSKTNAVRTVEGFINQDAVYIRVEGQGAEASIAVVQVRTKLGGTDLNLAGSLHQGMALRLVK